MNYSEKKNENYFNRSLEKLTIERKKTDCRLETFKLFFTLQEMYSIKLEISLF